MIKKYDGLYIFTNAAKDDVLDKQIEKACAEITRLSGKVLSTEVLSKKTFARPMQKRESGVYVSVRFELDAQQMTALKNRYRLMDEVFRVQFLAVDTCREEKLVKQKESHAARAAAREAAAEAAAEEAKQTEQEA